MAEKLIFARHGESEFSVRQVVNGDPSRECELTEQGTDEALDLALELKGVGIDLCVTSEFSRVVKTADIVIGSRSIPREVDPRLNDPRAGEFETRPLGEYLQWLDGCDWATPAPGGGESQLDAVGRYLGAFQDLVLRCEAVILVVCHALPISVALAMCEEGAPALRRRYDTAIPYATPFKLTADQLREGLTKLKKELEEATVS